MGLLFTAWILGAVLAGCGDGPYSPQLEAQKRHMLALCRAHQGVNNFHEVIDNSGAIALYGEIDFTCRDGWADILYWDDQGAGTYPGEKGKP